jgi:hypothetical protein
MILPAVIAGFVVSRIFIDGGRSLNLMYADTLRKMNISPANLTPMDTRFHGITLEKPNYPLGKISMYNLELEKISEGRSWSLKL